MFLFVLVFQVWGSLTREGHCMQVTQQQLIVVREKLNKPITGQYTDTLARHQTMLTVYPSEKIDYGIMMVTMGKQFLFKPFFYAV